MLKRMQQSKAIWAAKPLEVKQAFTEENLRPWQRELYAEVRGVPDDRKIIWYVDIKGGAGKSVMAKFLGEMENAFMVQDGAKLPDVAFAYSKSLAKIVIFDIARSHTEHLPYDQMEKFKNGVMFSPKYESKQLFFPSPWVVVFSNSWPNEEMLSRDRWDIRDLGARAERDAIRLARGEELDDTDTDNE